jgi:hypothetical protein
MASFVLNELRQVGVEATLRIIETVQWYGIVTRKDFQIGANISGYGGCVRCVPVVTSSQDQSRKTNQGEREPC